MSIVDKAKAKNTIQSTLGKSQVQGGQIGEYNIFKHILRYQ